MTVEITEGSKKVSFNNLEDGDYFVLATHDRGTFVIFRRVSTFSYFRIVSVPSLAISVYVDADVCFKNIPLKKIEVVDNHFKIRLV